jgi:SAM-dependent methyltransferase
MKLAARILLALWVGACRTTAPPVEPAPDCATADGRATPASVRPGINDRYFEPDSLEESIGQLERKEREVVAFRPQIVEAMQLTLGMRVADVGAGTGAYLDALAAAVGPTGRLYATDIVPAFLARLRERKAAAALDWVEVVEATPLDPGLPEAALDVVLLCDVYHHVEYPKPYLERLHAALVPGGTLVVVDFERIEGVTSPRMLAHVRAGKETFVAEIEAAGFRLEEEVALGLRESYFLRFRRP